MKWTGGVPREPGRFPDAVNYLLHLARRERPGRVVALAQYSVSEVVLASLNFWDGELRDLVFRVQSITRQVWHADGVDLVLVRIDRRWGAAGGVLCDYRFPLTAPVSVARSQAPLSTDGMVWPDPYGNPFPPPPAPLRPVWIDFETGQIA